MKDSEELNQDADQAPSHSTPQDQISQDEATDAPATDDPVGTRLLYVVVGMIVLMFLISVGFLLLVVRHRL